MANVYVKRMTAVLLTAYESEVLIRLGLLFDGKDITFGFWLIMIE